MKKRHSSEEIFFDLMKQKAFRIEDTRIVALPGDERIGEETVFVYTFRPEDRLQK